MSPFPFPLFLKTSSPYWGLTLSQALYSVLHCDTGITEKEPRLRGCMSLSPCAHKNHDCLTPEPLFLTSTLRGAAGGWFLTRYPVVLISDYRVQTPQPAFALSDVTWISFWRSCSQELACLQRRRLFFLNWHPTRRISSGGWKFLPTCLGLWPLLPTHTPEA